MHSSRSKLIRKIVADFAPRHVHHPRVFLPGRKLDWQALVELGGLPFGPVAAPDVAIHDLERDWLLLFDAAGQRRHINEARRKELAAQFAPCGKNLAFFTAFTDLNSFSRFAESIA